MIIRKSIQEILNILNHPMYSSQNGKPAYFPLPEESVRLLNAKLKCLRESLAEMEEVRKNELKLDELEEYRESCRFSFIQVGDKWHEIIFKRYSPPTEPKWLEPVLREPILREPVLREPKLLEKKPQRKSDGWRQPDKTQRKPFHRY
jgi:hypothetical protein